MNKKELKECETFLEEKTKNFYKKKFKNKENLDEIIFEELKELFIKIGTIYIHINTFHDSSKLYKKDNKNKKICILKTQTN